MSIVGVLAAAAFAMSGSAQRPVFDDAEALLGRAVCASEKECRVDFTHASAVAAAVRGTPPLLDYRQYTPTYNIAGQGCTSLFSQPSDVNQVILSAPFRVNVASRALVVFNGEGRLYPISGPNVSFNGMAGIGVAVVLVNTDTNAETVLDDRWAIHQALLNGLITGVSNPLQRHQPAINPISREALVTLAPGNYEVRAISKWSNVSTAVQLESAGTAVSGGAPRGAMVCGPRILTKPVPLN